MNPMTTREKVLEIASSICPAVDFENETALIDDQILESLDIVSIVSELMYEFDIQIDVDDLAPENFNSLDAIAELVESYL